MAGHALSRIQCALMLGNLVGVQIAQVPATDNIIADCISRIPSAHDLPTLFLTIV